MPATNHLAFLVEEQSMEAFLNGLLPKIARDCPFSVHVFRGKRDLMKNLNARLRAYKHWLPPNMRLFVLVDRNGDDCNGLKLCLERAAIDAGLTTRTQAGNNPWQAVNRIVIEELEAWYFGDWEAVRKAYPRTPDITKRSRYRDPDAVPGGTWEAFERVLGEAGYFKTGLRKVEAARAIAPHMDPERNRSRSFKAFCAAVIEAVEARG